MLVLSEPLTQESLREAADRLNQICAGLDAEQIKSHTSEFAPLETDVAQIVLSILEDVKTNVKANKANRSCV